MPDPKLQPLEPSLITIELPGYQYPPTHYIQSLAPIATIHQPTSDPHRLSRYQASRRSEDETRQERLQTKHAMESSRMCFRCHTINQFSGRCNVKGNFTDGFPKMSFWGLDSPELDGVVPDFDCESSTASTIQIILHLLHAVENLNQYQKHVLQHDGLFRAGVKHCVPVPSIDNNNLS